MIPHPYEIPSTVRSRAARLAEAARTYYTAKTGGARFRAWQEMQEHEHKAKAHNLYADLLEAVEQLLASENTEIRANYERSFADTDKLIALQSAMEAIHDR